MPYIYFYSLIDATIDQFVTDNFNLRKWDSFYSHQGFGLLLSNQITALLQWILFYRLIYKNNIKTNILLILIYSYLFLLVENLEIPTYIHPFINLFVLF